MQVLVQKIERSQPEQAVIKCYSVTDKVNSIVHFIKSADASLLVTSKNPNLGVFSVNFPFCFVRARLHKTLQLCGARPSSHNEKFPRKSTQSGYLEVTNCQEVKSTFFV